MVLVQKIGLDNNINCDIAIRRHIKQTTGGNMSRSIYEELREVMEESGEQVPDFNPAVRHLPEVLLAGLKYWDGSFTFPTMLRPLYKWYVENVFRAEMAREKGENVREICSCRAASIGRWTILDALACAGEGRIRFRESAEENTPGVASFLVVTKGWQTYLAQEENPDGDTLEIFISGAHIENLKKCSGVTVLQNAAQEVLAARKQV